jgi:MFS transporter, OFA family, oxalate/formate antiporter
VLVGIGSMVMINPPDGFCPAGWVPPTGKAADSRAGSSSASVKWSPPRSSGACSSSSWWRHVGAHDHRHHPAVRHGVPDGPRLPEVDALLATGTAMGLFYALANGIGRIPGAASPTIGRRLSIALMSALQGVMMIAFFFVGATEIGLYLGAAVIGFNFGGNFALFPAATADYFGNKNVGTNYPLVFLSYGVGGIVGPILGGMMGDLQAWQWAFIPAGIACLVAAMIALRLTPPIHPATVPVRTTARTVRPMRGATGD